MWRSVKRLEADLERWRGQGWVTEEGAHAIRAELTGGTGRVGLAGVLATLGAVLIGFAVMSFVAANWDAMSKLARIVMLLGAMAGAYGIAGVLATRGHRAFADAAVLAGAGIFGGAIMLIAQMYHMEGHPPDAVLLWGGGALLAGAALRSRPTLALAMLLAALWAGWETSLSQSVFWPFLLAWSAVTAAIAAERWDHGLKLAATVLAAWIVSLGYILNKGHAHELVLVIGLLAAAAGLFADRIGHTLANEAAPQIVRLGVAIAFAALFALQFFEAKQPVGILTLFAVMALALTLATVWWGWHVGHKDLLWLGYAGFSVEILALYFRTIGTLLGSSVFFLTVGLVVIALAWAAMRLNRNTPSEGAAR